VADEQSVSSGASLASSNTTDAQSSAPVVQQSHTPVVNDISSAHRLATEAPPTSHSHRHSVTDMQRQTSDSSTTSVIRQYRFPSVTKQMPLSSTTGRNVHISDDCKTACRVANDFCNAYVFTQQPLLPGEELVIRIAGINLDYLGGLTVGLTSCDPSTLQTADLPDDADKLLDRPEYWVVHKRICSHPKVNDELAFLRTVSGKFFC